MKTIIAAAAMIVVATAARGAGAADPVSDAGLNDVGGVGDVGVLAPSPADTVLVHAVARIRLELGAAGLPSHLVDCTHPDALETDACVGVRAEPHAVPPPTVPVPVPPPRTPTAVLSLSRRSRAVMVEAVASLPSGTKVFRLVHVPSTREGGGDPDLLAIRAAELLRDVRLEVVRSAREEESQRLKLQQERRAAMSAPASARTRAFEADEPVGVAVRESDEDLDRSRKSRISGWRIAGGATVIQGRRGFGVAIAPTIAVVVPVRGRLAAELVLAGPFFRTLDVPGYGGIDTRQEFAGLGVRWGRERGAVRPYLAAAGGVYHVRAAAWTDSLVPTLQRPLAQAMWAPLLSGRAGASVPINDLMYVNAEVGMLFTAPAADIAIDLDVYGRTGGPSFLYQAALAVVLP